MPKLPDIFAEMARGATNGAGAGVGAAHVCPCPDRTKVRAIRNKEVGKLGIVACADLLQAASCDDAAVTKLTGYAVGALDGLGAEANQSLR